MKPPRALVFLLGLFLLGVAVSARAQEGPRAGDHELQIWSSDGYGVRGEEKNTGIWSAGGRYGWVLTDPHGPGWLRGRFEYAVGVDPIVAIHQHRNTAYGAALTPLDLKWDFETHRSIVPFADLSGSALFTNNQVPPGTSRVNFESGAGLGVHVLAGRINWSAEVRYVHISNAGLGDINPGINTLQLRIGVGLFTHGRS